ncbi:MAG: hypothetical protein NTX63_02950 [Candidatus Peregrinibacteria bacterium]|nr:hypothetical protein [Candidatus Peregrinibacteria bacterium]
MKISPSRLLIENTVKNVIVFALLLFSYGNVTSYITSLATDAIGYQTIIVLSSLLIMAFLFASYTFTFKDSKLDKPIARLFDYFNTGIMIYGCGLLLEISYITVNAELHSTFSIMGILMVLFYISLVLFDYWDLVRAYSK